MNANNNEETHQVCPICFRLFPIVDIEKHVNKCIFLNSVDEQQQQQKRKRTPSPSLSSQGLICKRKSPKDCSTSKPQKHEDSENITRPQTNILDKTQPSSSDSNKRLQDEQNLNNYGSNKVARNGDINRKELTPRNAVPLAKHVQPRNLEDFFGQNHILGKDTVLYSLLQRQEIPNMILWGPPGCGKTSLANIIKEICASNPKSLKFVGLCAATSGIKEVADTISTAKACLKFGKRTVLFMDEIHRFNKRQQDSFLIHVEKGDIILIGATTENPSFYINSALLSRCRVIVFEKLTSEDLILILERALQFENVEIVEDKISNKEANRTAITKSAIEMLADISDGDARIALNNLELILQYNGKEKKVINSDTIKEGITKSHLLYDRKGEEHYNLISAMHKSIRGSDDNAALYWTTRMIMSGEDPLFIARRMVRAASEDIGNADPSALQLAVSTMQGCQLLGMPEADCLLAQCAIYLARAPKSREADSALAAAKQTISNWKGPQPSVPMHIRNAPTKLMKTLGYGKLAPGCKMTFMPPGLEDVNFF